MIDIKQASLLGLPRELRLKILEYLIEADVNSRVPRSDIGDYEAPSNRRWRQLLPQTQPAEHYPSLHVPWIPISQTCKVTLHEVRSLVNNTATQNCDQVYDLAIDFGTSKEPGDPLRIIWTKIPCAPQDAKVLLVTITADPHFSLFGDGGPSRPARILYRLLHSILHYGPRLTAAKPLAEHMRLQELRVIVKQYHDPVMVDDWDERFSKRGQAPQPHPLLPCWHLWRVLSTASGSGLLTNYVEQVRLEDERREYEFELGEVPGWKPSKVWVKYGFDWENVCQS
jgi:hypothetical protein